MNIKIVYSKNKIDGNIYPMVHTWIGEQSPASKETNSITDLVFFKFMDTTTKGFIAPISKSHLTSTY